MNSSSPTFLGPDLIRSALAEILIADILTVLEVELREHCQIHKRIPALYLKQTLLLAARSRIKRNPMQPCLQVRTLEG